MGRTFARDDRGTSIAISHVMTIGITAILISGLLIGGSTMLDSEHDRSVEGSLDTIGERLATEVAHVDRLGANESGNVTMRTDHPRSVASSNYRVELHETCDDGALIADDDQCIRLTASDVDVEVFVPVRTNASLTDGTTANGGSVEIVYEYDEGAGEGEIRIQNQ